MSAILFEIIPRSTELPRRSIKPSTTQRLQIYHTIATVANNNRGIDAPNQPPPHSIRAPISATRHLRIREREANACFFVARVCAVQDVELAAEPTNHPIVSLRGLYFTCRNEYIFSEIWVWNSEQYHPSIHQLTHTVIFFKNVLSTILGSGYYRDLVRSMRRSPLHRPTRA